MLGRRHWVVQEASNPDALQEAGTFRYLITDARRGGDGAVAGGGSDRLPGST